MKAHILDQEARRPGISELIKDLKEKYPRMSEDQVLAQSKELWHELNPKRPSK